jgi:uncharacterized protein YlxW (UPF0749 family)
MTTEQIATILASLGVGTWLGNVIKQFLQSRSDTDIKKLEYDKENTKNELKIADLQKEITDLAANIAILKQEVDKYTELYNSEKEDKLKAQQQLATINVAFDIIYAQLKKMFGDDESDLLNQLKKYIDDNTNRNTT